ncbi:hypothetical protein [Methylobacterium sp. sgz302541]|uniref:hypothetical protein n=1 Tax=unclassified Methylobacterium TaxID=2615210 RepID=UPI003D348F26
MALSRSKTQPDRPIWPAAPASGGSQAGGQGGRDRADRPSPADRAAGSQAIPSTMAQTEGFGSFAG